MDEFADLTEGGLLVVLFYLILALLLCVSFEKLETFADAGDIGCIPVHQ